MLDEALAKKLRLPANGKIAVVEPPDHYLPLLGLTPDSATLTVGESAAYDFVQLFARHSADVERLAPAAIRAVNPDGLLWMCYPKGTSKLKTDINRDTGWKIVSDAGWEGIALVSIDETWSAMRFRPREAVGKSRPSPAERKAGSANKPAEPPLAAPDDFRAALDSVPEAAALFDRLAPSHKKEYVRWIVEAKKAETRASRIVKAVEKLGQGLKRPSDKS